MAVAVRSPRKRSGHVHKLEMISTTKLFEGAFLSVVSNNRRGLTDEVTGRWIKFSRPTNLQFYNLATPRQFGEMTYCGAFVFIIDHQLWCLMHGIRQRELHNQQFDCDIVAVKLNPLEISIRHDNAVLEQKIVDTVKDKVSFSHTLVAADRFGNIICPSSSKYTRRAAGIVEQSIGSINVDAEQSDIDPRRIQRGANKATSHAYTSQSQEPLAELIMKLIRAHC